jgi:hypothetical protein
MSVVEVSDSGEEERVREEDVVGLTCTEDAALPVSCWDSTSLLVTGLGAVEDKNGVRVDLFLGEGKRFANDRGSFVAVLSSRSDRVKIDSLTRLCSLARRILTASLVGCFTFSLDRDGDNFISSRLHPHSLAVCDAHALGILNNCFVIHLVLLGTLEVGSR